MKKTIVFIITDYGSFNNFLGELAINLARLGSKVHLISSNDKVIDVKDKFDYYSEGIKFHPIDLPRSTNPFKLYMASNLIKRKLNEINPDIVSIHFTTGIFTTIFSGKLKYKTIGTFHGLGYPVMESTIKKMIYKFVESLCVRRINQVWVLNKMDVEVINNDFPKTKVFQLPTKGLGCDLIKFNPNKFDLNSKNLLKQKLGIAENDFVITFTGRYVHFKGFDKVIRAFKIIQDVFKINNIKLVTIGGKDLLHKTGLSIDEENWRNDCENIIDVGFTSEVELFLSITDLFVFPSEKEGMPVCIIESLAMGIPVLTANARGCNDLIINELNGVLLSENTPENIAAEIVDLRKNKLRYDAMVHNIFQDREKLDRKLFVQQQLNLFESI